MSYNLDNIKDVVKNEFSFLTNYEYICTNYLLGTIYHIIYEKSSSIIDIKYSPKNNYFEIEIINKVSPYYNTTDKWKYAVSLSALFMFNHLTNEDYESVMPYKIGLQKSVECLKAYFIEFALPAIQKNEQLVTYYSIFNENKRIRDL